MTPNEKRIASCKKVGGAHKRLGHKKEDYFNKQFNPSVLGSNDYGANADCTIADGHPIRETLKESLDLPDSCSYHTTNKSGKGIQLTLGKINELDMENNLDIITDKSKSRKIFNKYLKKTESRRPADLLVYYNDETDKWEFFKTDTIINFIVNKCIWRKLASGRLKGDFLRELDIRDKNITIKNLQEQLSNYGLNIKGDKNKMIERLENYKTEHPEVTFNIPPKKIQYLTYEYRKNHKSYFLGFSGGKGKPFIELLKKNIPYHSESFNFE